jgi:hypothetical protein
MSEELEGQTINTEERAKHHVLYNQITLLPNGLDFLLAVNDGITEQQRLRSELQKQKELNAELVETLEWVENDIKVLSKVTDKTYDLVESLIKKSKES